MSELIHAIRVYSEEGKHLIIPDGCYGFDPCCKCWRVRPPGCAFDIDIPYHTVKVNEDMSITVHPSIAVYGGSIILWHGYLENGYWNKID